MKWTEIQAGSVYAAGHQLLTALGDNADSVVAQINSDSSFVERLAKFAICGGFKSGTSQEYAQKIMGKNFFGIREATKHFGIKPRRRQLAILSEIPFSEEVLERCKDTHVLVVLFPISILEIQEKVEGNGLFYRRDWFYKQAFAKEMGGVGWQLVRKTEVPDSFNKDWSEQQSLLLSKDEQTPTARVVIYTIIGHYLNTGERLFEKMVRTSSISSANTRVLVGSFAKEPLEINCESDCNYGPHLGISSVRKPTEP